MKHYNINWMWNSVNLYNPYFFSPFYYPFGAGPIVPDFSQRHFPFQSHCLQKKSLSTQSEEKQEVSQVEIRILAKTPKKANKKILKKQRLEKKKERDDNFERKKQKKDRNLPSNILKHFLNFLYNHPRKDYLLAGLQPSQNSESFNLDFFTGLKAIIKQNQSYIRPKIVTQLCRGELMGESFSRAFRILLNKFLTLQIPLCITAMTKLKRRQRLEQLKTARKLQSMLLAR